MNLDKLKNIKLILTDNDGVLTDGGFYYSNSGDVSVRYNTLDGMGIVVLQEKYGVEVSIISGSGADYIKLRAEKLGIKNVYLRCFDKLAKTKEIMQEKKIMPEEILFIGDDINDTEAMLLCGLRATVSNAHSSIIKITDYVSTKKGGEGAVREIIDLIIQAKENS